MTGMPRPLSLFYFFSGLLVGLLIGGSLDREFSRNCREGRLSRKYYRYRVLLETHRILRTHAVHGDVADI